MFTSLKSVLSVRRVKAMEHPGQQAEDDGDLDVETLLGHATEQLRQRLARDVLEHEKREIVVMF